MTEFCTVAPNTISIIIAVFDLCTRMCISSYAPSRKHQVTLRFTSHARTVGLNTELTRHKTLNDTVIISGTPYGHKMSDYVLLKTVKIYTVIKNIYNCF